MAPNLLTGRTAKKHRSERKGRRSSDTAIEYDTMAMMAAEKTRTAKLAVRAACLVAHDDELPRRRGLWGTTTLRGARA